MWNPKDSVNHATTGSDGDRLIQSGVEDAGVWRGDECHLECGGALTKRAFLLGSSGRCGGIGLTHVAVAIRGRIRLTESYDARDRGRRLGHYVPRHQRCVERHASKRDKSR